MLSDEKKDTNTSARYSKRSSSQLLQPHPHAMAICEVFNFSNGVVDQLRADVASFPAARKHHKKKPKYTPTRKKSAINTLTKVDLSMLPGNQGESAPSSADQNIALRKLSVISKIKQTYANRCADNSPETEVKRVNVTNIEAPKIYVDKPDSEDDVSCSREVVNASSVGGELSLPDLDLHRNSVSTIEAEKRSSTLGSIYYEFPAATPHLTLPKIERRGEEAINIYKMARQRARIGLVNLETQNQPKHTNESSFQMSSLSGQKMQQMAPPKPIKIVSKVMVSTREAVRKQSGRKEKTAMASSTVKGEKPVNSGKKSKQVKMFLECDYNQFCHRKVKKGGVLPEEGTRRELPHTTNLISRQYDQHEFKKYRKLKIGDLVSASPIADLLPHELQTEDSFYSDISC